MFYYSNNGINIYQDDVLKIKDIEDNSVDLIITSPPYNLGIEYSEYDDTVSYSEYLKFCEAWCQKLLSLGKPDCRFCLNVPVNIKPHPSGCDIVGIAMNMGWKYKTTIIWDNMNASKRTAWGSWLSASAPHVVTPIEFIHVFYKDVWKKQAKGVTTISRDDFIAWTYGMWRFNSEKKTKIGHPAPFPVELPKRCIELFSYQGDLVLDPFMGSGTTLVAARETERKAIGIDISKEYCDLAKNRLEE